MSLLEDVESLKAKPLPEIREKIAEKVAVYFTKGVFDEGECEIACEILRMLARDIETRVRKTISENLKNTKSLPRDIALKLAHDVLEVSLPILEFSNVLTDDDLIDIISSTKQVAKLIAISKRNNVSEALSGELVKTSNEDVVVSLFSNGTARISQDSLQFAFNEFKNNGKVVGALINRGDLSVSVVEKILNAVSIQVRNELVKTHKLDERKATAMVSAGQERTTLGLLNELDSQQAAPVQERIFIDETAQTNNDRKFVQTENLVSHLFKEGRLTESLILRSICEGNMLFFEISMARRAGIPIVNARALIQDGNSAALKSLWKRAKMPDSAFEAMNVIIGFAVTYLNGGGEKAAFSNQLLEHVQEKGYEKTIHLMPYIMALVASGVHVHDVV